jgi:hypothetical protein
MRAYLDQVACVLRPGSVAGADLALRSLATCLPPSILTCTGSSTSDARISKGSSRGWRPARDRTAPS